MVFVITDNEFHIAGDGAVSIVDPVNFTVALFSHSLIIDHKCLIY